LTSVPWRRGLVVSSLSAELSVDRLNTAKIKGGFKKFDSSFVNNLKPVSSLPRTMRQGPTG
jgi:hypothetical protein